MIFITGPLYSGKRTFAQTLPGKALADVQQLAADAADLPALADKLAHEYDILIATEVGGGVVPMDPKQRADREAAGRQACPPPRGRHAALGPSAQHRRLPRWR